MGKKTKRARGGGGGGGKGAAPPAAPAAPPDPDPAPAASPPPPPRKLPHPKGASKADDEEEEEETADNLRFEDPFEDVYEEEVCVDGDGGEDARMGGDDDEEEERAELTSKHGSALREARAGGGDVVLSWNPLTSPDLPPGTEMEVDESAYAMRHAVTPEWPALSFDFLRDGLGDGRRRFPHSVIVAAGSQSGAGGDRNRLTVMRMSDLGRTHRPDEDDDDDDEWEDTDDEGDEESGGDDDEDEDDADLDPVLEHYSLRHSGCVNRVRSMPQNPAVVATWSDSGAVNLYDVGGILDAFERSSGSADAGGKAKFRRDPFFVYRGHGAEGYALDWSSVLAGRLATGDCRGNVRVWDPADPLPGGTAAPKGGWGNSSFGVRAMYGPDLGSSDGCDNLDNPSVEDLQWSPTEATVLAAAECGGYVKVYDIRAPKRAMISRRVHPNGSDVNAIAWNRLVGNLLASGGDDGALNVWDLRTFQKPEDGDDPAPLARFTCHRTPITSLQWHPTDESMLAVSDEAGAYVYDLSVEEDEDGDGGGGGGNKDSGDGAAIPPQLLFVHGGSEQTKEVRWHPQVPSLMMTTGAEGFSVFIPSNL